jgi:LPXTG-motif cell wall-anchored protein
MKRNRTKRILSMLLTLCMVVMCLVVLPVQVHAADNIAYLDAAGVERTAPTAIQIKADTDTLTTGWYVVIGPVERKGTITVDGDVHLILANGSTLNVEGSGKNAGIRVAGSNKLTIYAQSTDKEEIGKIESESGWVVHELYGYLISKGAGIGGNEGEDGGHITINGGRISATGYVGSAGIGGGYQGGAGTIIINGGIVGSYSSPKGTAVPYGAGIGSGEDGRDGGSITINGGNVYAEAQRGAGIGGGWRANGGNITINAGSVTAVSTRGAGIGGGYGADGGDVTINGGTVTARSVGYYHNHYEYSYGSGAGIGSGASSNVKQTNGGNIIITGGVVNAKAWYGGAGIGGGAWDNYLLEFKYNGGNGGNINISGGVVNAIGTFGGAGIGGGVGGNGAEVTISGGTISAESIQGMKDLVPEGSPYSEKTYGEYSGQDIGGGCDASSIVECADASSNGSLTVSGTSALFLRNDKSTPVTTLSHGHKTFSDSTAVTGFTVPTTWDSDFGAWLLPQLYAVTVNSGTGGGDFTEGATVSITANAPATGKVFDKWTTTDGVAFADANSATTTFVMPDKAVTVKATYKDISSETPDYKIIAGENGIWKKDSTEDIVIISNGDYGDFTGVNVDDIFIDSSNYTSAAGSTVVTLKPAYLETLAVGTHIVTLQFGNYSVQTNLTILAADERPDESKPDESKPNEELPKTGDSNHTLPLIGLLLLSGSALIGVSRKEKKKKSYNK